MSFTAALVLATGLLACGGDGDDGPSASDVPDGAVAKVGDVTITEADLQDQLDAARRTRPTSEPAYRVLEPPEFEECVDKLERKERKGGNKKPDRKQLKETCKAEFGPLLSQALGDKLRTVWIEQEAQKLGVRVTAEEMAQLRSGVEGQFDTEKDLRVFLGGQTKAELFEDLREQQLSQKITEKAVEDVPPKQRTKATQLFLDDFQKRWSKATVCAEDYEIAQCVNYSDPAESTSTTQAPPAK